MIKIFYLYRLPQARRLLETLLSSWFRINSGNTSCTKTKIPLNTRTFYIWGEGDQILKGFLFKFTRLKSQTIYQNVRIYALLL